MSHRAKPKLAKCFRCKEWFLIKFVPFYKRFSLKNDWDYWTKKIESKKIESKKIESKKICNACLEKLFENKQELKQTFPDAVLQRTLKTYVQRQRLIHN